MFLPYPSTATIRAGISTRDQGNMRATDPESDLVERRAAYLGSVGMKGKRVVIPLLVHGTNVAVVRGDEVDLLFPGTDALVTQSPDVVLTVTAADCLPVYFLDTSTGAIGLAHAGWRGLVSGMHFGNPFQHNQGIAGVIGATFEAMRRNFGTQTDNLHVAIGPSIGPCHYPVGENVRDAVRHAVGMEAVVGEAVDLRLVARLQLMRLGISSANIFSDPPCTSCHKETYFSARADGAPLRAQLAWIARA